MLGDALVTAGAITAAQLERALAEQRVTGALLGETLVAMKFITEETLARALAQQAGMPFAPNGDRSPDPAAVALVPEPFARRHLLAPLGFSGEVLHIVQANPFDVLALDDLRQLTSRSVSAVCATAAHVRALLNRAYARPETVSDRREHRTVVSQQDDARDEGQLLHRLVRDAISNQATDLHIEPDEQGVAVRYRIDGVLVPGEPIPSSHYVRLSAEMKTVAGLDPAESTIPQEGRTSPTIDGRRIDLVVTTMPTMHGEKIALRVLDKTRPVRALAELGLSRKDLGVVNEILDKPRGIVLVSGPTGSGATSTLYAMLAHLASVSKSIITLEDPVEKQIPSIRQTQIRPTSGFTFATAMRSVLRQNPDVVMLGDMRDPETAQIALRAAVSGIVVLGALPADDAASAVTRLTDMGLEPYLLASGLVAVVAQRLVRLICHECSEGVEYPVETLERFGLTDDPGLLFHRGRGCSRCRATGYRGRVGVFEVLAVDTAMQTLIRDRADSRVVRQTAVRTGMKTLRDDALAKAILQQTTIEEVVRLNVPADR
ncbi:MAG TPA: GspE/PulE family protein [Vicinamibacterales bacterium]